SYNTDNITNQALWDALRNCRKKLAEELAVPPFVIFHDATLAEMLERRPENRAQFASLNGVGESKLEKYADAFLAVIEEYADSAGQGTTDTIAESLLLFRSGLDIQAIAEKRQLKDTTVYSHLASCIEQGEVTLEEVVDLKQQDINLIHETLLGLEDGSRKLKPVYDALDGMFDYNTLRCVQAALQ
ncbi:MAG TPA: ATP-dependent DNA helicase RecQ, partial [Thiotrichales bacterium]|nr:ATP-dependent DNA helicase RecQ [Thiotrichales bacterium]